MTYKILATSCDTGPCGRFHLDGATGDVYVQGYLTDERPEDAPAEEGFLKIPADQWAVLLSRLPRV